MRIFDFNKHVELGNSNTLGFKYGHFVVFGTVILPAPQKDPSKGASFHDCTVNIFCNASQMTLEYVHMYDKC